MVGMSLHKEGYMTALGPEITKGLSIVEEM